MVWYPQPGFADRLLRAAERARCYGPSVFDLRIALTAAEHCATEIWTHDHGFASVAGQRVVDPLD
ncbi:MAG: type II toxin-antitoxin system VapC family toxin [Terriglobales bacterium]